jgi:hypothetical protein
MFVIDDSHSASNHGSEIAVLFRDNRGWLRARFTSVPPLVVKNVNYFGIETLKCGDRITGFSFSLSYETKYSLHNGQNISYFIKNDTMFLYKV